MENPWRARIEAISDPVERAMEIAKILNEMPNLSHELKAMRQAAILELRAAGWSYGRIGEALGIHRNRVQQIAEGRNK